MLSTEQLPIRRFHPKMLILFLAVFLILQLPYLVIEQLAEPNRNVLALSEDNQWVPYDGWGTYEGWQFRYIKMSNEETNKQKTPISIDVPVPLRDWQAPHLTVFQFKNIAIYLDNQLIYSFQQNESYANWPFHWQIIPLPSDTAGRTLTVQYYENDDSPNKGEILLGNKSDLIYNVFLEDIHEIAFASIFLFISVTSLFLYMRNSRDKTYLYFSLLVFDAFYAAFFRTKTVQLLLGVPFFVYIVNLILPFGALMFMLFFEQIYGPGYRNAHRHLWQSMLVFLVLCIIVAFINPEWYIWLSIRVFAVIYIPIFGILLVTAIRAFIIRKDVETGWYLLGYVTFGCYILISQIVYEFGYLMPFLFTDFFNYLWLNDRVYIGLFMLIFSMAMILRERMENIYIHAQQTADELATITDSLERLVQERTADLEKTNAQLRRSMQETAQAFAEISVLEERTRIAHDIHDHAGHTLTAALVQMEATKRLMNVKPGVALEKLETSQQLVRKGLNQIRKSVRHLNEPKNDDNFIDSIHQLIRETEQTANVHVDVNVTAKLPPLNPIHQKVLYHTILEGLTNGIRHGNCRHFTLDMTYEHNVLRLQLINDGKPYVATAFGFGLTTMKQRVEQLGGTIDITAHGTEGCRLSIELPLPAIDEQ